ncbi:MAG: flagellar hook-length control protein FliK [Desulfosalsimonadaceae bacterium]
MYVSAPPPPVLSVAVPAEISMQQGTESQPLKLAQYQIVQATVAEGGMERVLLNVEQHQLSAETQVPLRQGQQLNLQVMATKPQIHLRILEEAELRHLFRLLNNLGENSRLAPLLESITSWAVRAGAAGQGGAEGGVPAETEAVLSQMSRLLGSDPAGLSGRDLSGLWHRLGLDLEALLASGREAEAGAGLKSVLFQLADRAFDPAGRPEGLEQVLEQLSLFQLCRHRLAQENTIFLPLPFSFLEQGYLMAERDDHGGAEDGEEEEAEQVFRMTLHVKLSSLGSLEIKLLFEDKALRLRVLCESRQTAEAVSRALPRLEEGLTTVALKGYSVGTGAEEPAASLVRRLAPDGKHFLEAQV